MRIIRPAVASLLALTLSATAATAVAGTATATTPPAPSPLPTLGAGADRALQDDTVPYAPQSTPAATSDLNGLLRADVASTSTHTLDVVIVDRKTASSNKTTTTNVNSLVSQVSSYWNQQSGGKVSFSVKTVKRLTTSTGCTTTDDITALWSQASKLVSGHDWWADGNPSYGPAAREHLVVLFPYDTSDDYVTGKDTGHTTCGGTLGLGTTPTTASLGNNGLTFALFGSSAAFDTSKPAFYTAGQSLAHELGHNFGLQHSSTWWCDNGANDAAVSTSSSACGMVSYEDPYDVMGAGFDDKGIPYLSGPQKARLGVLATGQRATISPTSTTTSVNLVAPPTTEVGASATDDQLASFKDPTTGEYYYVEYRPSIGNGVTFPLFSSQYPTYPRLTWGIYGALTDTQYSYKIDNGVRILRFAPSDTWGWSKYEQSIVPFGAANTSTTSPRTSYVPVGKTFTTRTGTLAITVNSQSTAAAKVTFTVKRHAPSLSIGRSASSQRYAQTAAKVSARAGSVDGKASTGTIAFKDGSTTLASVKTTTDGYAAITLPKTLSVRTHTITAVFTPDTATATRALSASGSTTVAVSKATSSVSASLSSSTVKLGTAPKLTVTLHVSGVSSPTGWIGIYEGSTRVGSLDVASSSHGKVTVTLPKNSRRGTAHVTVKYAGNSSIAASTSPSTTLHVV